MGRDGGTEKEWDRNRVGQRKSETETDGQKQSWTETDGLRQNWAETGGRRQGDRYGRAATNSWAEADGRMKLDRDRECQKRVGQTEWDKVGRAEKEWEGDKNREET